MLIFSGLKIYSEQGILNHAEVMVADGKIKEIGQSFSTIKEKMIFPESYHLLPGFIDIHIHGSQGSDVMDATETSLKTISAALAAQGTTAFLATTMTASIKEISQALQNVREYMTKQHEIKGARILGVHLEGPFVSPKKVGAQRITDILLPELAQMKKWQKEIDNAIKVVTLAPELSQSEEFIRYLVSEKIIVAIGHTDATYAETLTAIHAGCSHATHLFNAMRGIHQREPGAVSAILLAEKMTAELIVDGVHLHPAIVQLALKMKGKEKLILVTDAMRAQCLADGIYELGGQEVKVIGGVASLANGTLAGSTITLLSAIKNMQQFTDCSLQDAVRFASENPAKMLGIFQQKGSIAAGKDADLVVLDEELNVVLTMREGIIVYRR